MTDSECADVILPVYRTQGGPAWQQTSGSWRHVRAGGPTDCGRVRGAARRRRRSSDRRPPRSVPRARSRRSIHPRWAPPEPGTHACPRHCRPRNCSAGFGSGTFEGDLHDGGVGLRRVDVLSTRDRVQHGFTVEQPTQDGQLVSRRGRCQHHSQATVVQLLEDFPRPRQQAQLIRLVLVETRVQFVHTICGGIVDTGGTGHGSGWSRPCRWRGGSATWARSVPRPRMHGATRPREGSSSRPGCRRYRRAPQLAGWTSDSHSSVRCVVFGRVDGRLGHSENRCRSSGWSPGSALTPSTSNRSCRRRDGTCSRRTHSVTWSISIRSTRASASAARTGFPESGTRRRPDANCQQRSRRPVHAVQGYRQRAVAALHRDSHSHPETGRSYPSEFLGVGAPRVGPSRSEREHGPALRASRTG